VDFDARRERFRMRLIEDVRLGRVDFDIVDFLLAFNELRDYYTTSSCSGRVILARTPRLSYSKSEGIFRALGKWHRPVIAEEVLSSLGEASGDVWLIVRAPIIHIAARDMESASRLQRIMQRAGFKRGGIISTDPIILEAQGEDRAEIPLVVNGEWLIENIDKAVDIANEILIFGKLRLARLIRLIEAELMGRDFGEAPREYFKEGYREFKYRAT